MVNDGPLDRGWDGEHNGDGFVGISIIFVVLDNVSIETDGVWQSLRYCTLKH